MEKKSSIAFNNYDLLEKKTEKSKKSEINEIEIT
jgi:hypothetical protein